MADLDRVQKQGWTAVHHLAAALVTLLFLLPLVWVVAASLRQTGLPPPRTVEWWPNPARPANYFTIFDMLPLGRYTLNSLFVVAIAVPVTVFTASLAGLGMAQTADADRRRLFALTLVFFMVPAASVWLFRFQLLGWLGLLGSLWALILPAFAAGNPLYVFLYYWTFRRIPPEVVESARLDGASAWVVWRRLAMPLARPTTFGVAVLAFVLYWSDFISPVLYLNRPESYTLPIGLQILKQMDATNWPLMMAAAVVMTLPVVLLFIGLERYFLRDLLAQVGGEE